MGAYPLVKIEVTSLRRLRKGWGGESYGPPKQNIIVRVKEIDKIQHNKKMDNIHKFRFIL